MGTIPAGATVDISAIMMSLRSGIPAALTSVIFAFCLSISSGQELICEYDEVDLVFVIDSSGSVTAPNFEKVKASIKTFLADADIDGGKVRVGINVYSTFHEVEFQLNTYNNKVDMFNAIDNLPFKGQGTNTGSALETMRSEMFTSANGDRVNVGDVAIVISDGESFDNPIPVAERARQDNITLFAIGVGIKNLTELKGIANKPSEEYVFSIDSFNELDNITKKVFEAVCELPPIVTVPTTQPPATGLTTKGLTTAATPTPPAGGSYPPECNGVQFYFPDAENKCKYWQCDRFGRAFNRPCAFGLVWNQTDKVCVRPDGPYNCEGPTPPTPPTKPTLPPRGPTADYPVNGPYPPVCDGNRFYFPDRKNKCKFWQCDKFGVVYNMPCAYGLVWNQTDKDCVLPADGEYKCGVCDQNEVDLVFVLDASGSVTPDNFGKVKNFVKKFLLEADIDGGKVRVGVNVYSTFNEVAFNLNTYSSKKDVLNAIDALSFKGQGSRLGSALETMSSEMFTDANGDRANVSNVAIVITDGESDDSPIPVADAARSDGINIYTIGIGMANTTELEGIANKPSENYVFSIGEFGVLDTLDKEVFAAICAPTTAAPTTAAPTTAAPTTAEPTTEPLVTVTLPDPKCDDSACPADFCLVAGRCLCRTKPAILHDEALALCESMGAKLITPKTEEFFNILMDWEFVTIKHDRAIYWMGATNKNSTGPSVYYWEDGQQTPLTSTWSRWNEGRPWSSPDRCVVANRETMAFKDFKCDRKKAFPICEMPLPTTTIAP